MFETERTIHGPVEGLKTGRFGASINTTSICYRIGHTLIDTGPPNRWRAVRHFIDEQHEEHGIERLVLTHHHEDHAGNAVRIKKHLGVPVLAPEASIDPLAEGFPMEWYRRAVWGTPEPVAAQPVPETLTLENGWHLQRIAAPGHADDMVCYLVPEKGWLFSADLFIARKPRYLRGDEDLPQLIKTLRAVLEYDFDTLFCGHRGVVEDGQQALRDKIRYLEALCAVVRRRHESGQSIRHITNQMLGRDGWMRWISGGDFSKQNMVHSCLKTRNHRFA
jgi:glyoxylase-like metal-dependent hydrolase (beta-lactamase superfamily II)